MSYVLILKGISAWKPKHANRVGAPEFPIGNWKRKYTAAEKGRPTNRVVSNFTSAYNAWLTNFKRRNLAKKKEIENDRIALLREIRSAKHSATVAHRSPTPRRPNQVSAARHAKSRRSPSPRRRVLTAHMPANVRASFKLNAQLQNLVNNLHAQLRRPRSSHAG